MAFELNNLIDLAAQPFAATVLNPATSGEGGAKLIRFSQNPMSGLPPIQEVLGYVIASPNILRPYHNGFDPASERCRYEGDFIDKLIYVATGDLQANAQPVNAMGAALRLLGRLADPECSTGCSCSSRGTPIYKMTFGADAQGNVTGPTFEQDPQTYSVVAAKFLGATGMICLEFWIAADADRDLILNTPEYAAARQRSRDNCPPDALSRRQKTLEQIDRLRNANLSQVFQTSGC